jgi:hypothetical protein
MKQLRKLGDRSSLRPQLTSTSRASFNVIRWQNTIHPTRSPSAHPTHTYTYTYTHTHTTPSTHTHTHTQPHTLAYHFSWELGESTADDSHVENPKGIFASAWFFRLCTFAIVFEQRSMTTVAPTHVKRQKSGKRKRSLGSVHESATTSKRPKFKTQQEGETFRAFETRLKRESRELAKQSRPSKGSSDRNKRYLLVVSVLVRFPTLLWDFWNFSNFES